MKSYEPVETEIDGVKFRVNPLHAMEQVDLIFDLNELFSRGLKEAFGLEIGDVLRSEFDPNYEQLTKEQQIEIATTALFTKFPTAFFRFMVEADRELSKEFMKRCLNQIMVQEKVARGKSASWVTLDMELHIDATKLQHFRLLSWYVAVQLGPFTGWVVRVMKVLSRLLPTEKPNDTEALGQT